MNSGKRNIKLSCLRQRLLSSPLERGAGGVAANLHTPLSPLSRGESQKIEIPEHQVIPFKSPLTKGDSGGCVFSGLFPIFTRTSLQPPVSPFSKGD